MKIIRGKNWKIIRRIINTLTQGMMQSPPMTFGDRVSEAEFMLNHNNSEQNFLRNAQRKRLMMKYNKCLPEHKQIKEKNSFNIKCKHNKHILLRYFGVAWHAYCVGCGEHFCVAEKGRPSGNPSKEFLNKLAKKVEFI